METVILYLHSLAMAVLIGKVVLLSFVVAPILARQLDREPFGKVVRELFPAYYALGMGAAVMGLIAVLMLGIIHKPNIIRHLAAGIWLVILAAETYCRSPLTPQSNVMRDRLNAQESQGAADPALQQAWNRLHRRSISLNSLVLSAGLCLLGLTSQW